MSRAAGTGSCERGGDADSVVAATTVLLNTLDDESIAGLVDSRTLAGVRALRDRADARLRDLTDAQGSKEVCDG